MIYASTACVHSDNIKESVQALAKSGWKNIELSGGTKYYKNYLADLQQLKELYKLQFTCHGYFPPPMEDIVLNLASCNEEIYEKSINFYLDTVKVLEKLGGTFLSVHAGFYMDVSPREIGKKISVAKTYDEEIADQRFCRAIGIIQDVAKRANMSLLIENNVLSQENFLNFNKMNLFMMTDSVTIEKMRQKLDFDLLLDIGHLKVSAQTLELDFEHELSVLLPQAKWLHIHNNNGETDQHRSISEQDYIYTLLKKKIMSLPENVTIEVHERMEKVLASYQAIEKLYIEWKKGK